MNDTQKIPVTILTGFLGAGKTTLLNHLLHSDHGLRIAVLVNDFGEVNIDAQLIIGIEGETVSLSNGCICCTIRDDLEAAVVDLIHAPEPPEYIIIEASGVSDPQSVALTFVLSNELLARTKIDTILALIDTEQIFQLQGQSALLAERQISIADLLVLNKVDLVTPDALRFVKKTLLELVPKARIVETTYGRILPELMLSVGRRTVETMQSDTVLDIHVHPTKTSSVGDHHHDHDHDHHHYDHDHDHEHHDHTLVFSTWRYRCERPFNYLALREVLKTLPNTIYRAKGILYLDNGPEQIRVLQIAGARISLSRGGEWGEQIPYSELVFIGEAESLDAPKLQADFDACLAENVRALPDSDQDTISWVRETDASGSATADV